MNPSLKYIPSSYKEGKTYSVIPANGDGDFVFSRASEGSRENANGDIETMAIDVPRLQYPSCPSLLLESSRTNLFEYSEELEQAVLVRATVNADSLTSPSGEVTGDKLIATTEDNSTHYCFKNTTIAAGDTVSATVYFKPIEYTDCFIIVAPTSSTGADRFGVYVVDGVITESIFGNGELYSSNIEEYINGYYKITLTGKMNDIDTNARLSMFIYSDGSLTFAGDDSKGLSFWGMQVEVGTYPTSYIKTEGATVTRAVDACNITNLITNGILTATEGTIAEQYDADKYAYRFTSDGNMETYKNGVSIGSVVQSPSESYDLKVPAEYVYLKMYPTPLTDQELIILTT